MGLYHSDVCLVLSARGLEDLTYRYDVSKSVARDVLLAVSEELQYGHAAGRLGSHQRRHGEEIGG